MKKFLRLLSFVLVSILLIGVNYDNVVAAPSSVTIKEKTLLNYHNGSYFRFLVTTSDGVNRYAYCLDSDHSDPSGILNYIGVGGLDKNNSASNYYKIMSVLVAAGYPNYTLVDNSGNKLDDDHAFYVTQAAVWYARYGGAGLSPLTTSFHDRLLKSEMGNAYSKLIDAATNTSKYIGSNDAYITIYASDKSAISNEMEQKTINGEDILLSKTEFKIGMYQVTSDYTVNVIGGYLTNSDGTADYGTSKVFGPHDSFKIAIKADSDGAKTAKFTATLNNKVSRYDLAVYGKADWQTSSLQTVTMLVPSYEELKKEYSVNGNVIKKHEVFVNKVNKNDEKLAGALLEIYNDKDELITKVESSSEDVSVKLSAGNYYISEVKAPSGYILSNEKVYFSLTDEGNVLDVNGNMSDIRVVSIVNDLPTIKIRKINERNVDVKGAKIVICSYDMETKEESNCNFEWLTDGTTKELTVGVDFGSIEDGSYIIKEVEAPHGYELSAPKYITLSEGKLSGDYERDTVIIVDKSYLDISKTDVTGQDEVEGATLTLLDSTGKKIEEWVSTKESHRIYGLDTTQVYELIETQAPKGYVPLSVSVKFKLNEDGTVTTYDAVTMKELSNEDKLNIKNEVTKIKVSKVDITNEQELPGAKLQILNEDGTPVYQDGKILEWTSTNEPHYIEMLPVGNYKLIETFSPSGYVAVSNEVLFEVKAESGIQTVVFRNDVTKVMISKKDFTTGEEIPGATLKILDENGNPVYQNGEELVWVSTDEPHYIEKLPIGKYILVETLPAEGYEEGMYVDGILTSKYEFEVKDNILLKIEVCNKVMEVPSTGINISSSYMVGFGIITLGFGTVLVARRREV